MVVTRRTFLPLLLVAVFLTFGTVSVFAKDKDTTSPVNGVSTGSSTNTSNCDPLHPTPTNLVCTFAVNGSYSAMGIGSGTYSGTTTIDYTKYGTAGKDPNGGGACTPVTGSITFTKSPGNTLTTTLAPSSKVCETGAAGSPHHTYLVLTITGGTGQFHGATGTINSTGISTDDPSNARLHHDMATLTGSITLEHGNNGHGCGNDGHENGKGNGGDDNGNDHCGSDHGDGNDDNGGDNEQVT